jgi:hypothetical protein
LEGGFESLVVISKIFAFIGEGRSCLIISGFVFISRDNSIAGARLHSRVTFTLFVVWLYLNIQQAKRENSDPG